MNSSTKDMPGSVKIAVGLLIGSLLVGVGKWLTEPVPEQYLSTRWFGVLLLGVVVTLLAALMGAVASGRRWAAVVFAVVFVVSLPSAVERQNEVGVSSLEGATLLLQTVTQLIAMLLLFRPPARVWFEAARKGRAA